MSLEHILLGLLDEPATGYDLRRRFEEDLAATAVSLAVGAGVAAVTFYLTRILLSREDMLDGPRRDLLVASAGGEVTTDDGPTA